MDYATSSPALVATTLFPMLLVSFLVIVLLLSLFTRTFKMMLQ